jgi:hypothetical protein
MLSVLVVQAGRNKSLPSEGGRNRIAKSKDRDGGDGVRLQPSSAACSYVVHTLELWCRVEAHICYGSSILFFHSPVHGLVIRANNGCNKRLRLTCKDRYLRWRNGHCDLRQWLNGCLPKQEDGAGHHCHNKANGDYLHGWEPP